MPELPDVAAFKDYVDASSLHHRIRHSRLTDRRILGEVTPQKLQANLAGSRLASTARHGKFLFAELDRGGWLVLHFGMTGGLAYAKQEDEPPRFTQLLLEFDNGYYLAYTCQRMLGRVSYAEDREAFIAERELGPDALAEDLDGEAFADLLAGRRGMIKSALMNQSIVAGMGNVYVDEVLFQAGIHPKTPIHRLDGKQIRTIYRTMRRVLHKAVEKESIIERLPASYLLPRRDTDRPCPRCGGPIRQMDVSGRTTHYCPDCQPEG